MVIKWVGAVLVIFAAGGIGNVFAGRIHEEEVWLKEIRQVLSLLSGELRYRRTPLPEALCDLGKHHQGVLCGFLTVLGGRLKAGMGVSLAELWEEQAKRSLKKAPLPAELKKEFLQLGEYIGEADDKAREDSLEFYLGRIERELRELQENGKGRAYLYRVLGMSGGVFLLLLML